MPLYEYACTKCNHHFDVRHSATETPVLCCPQCEGDVRKVFHAAGIIFKGSGWHIKDYGQKSDTSSETTTPATESSTAASS